MLRTLLIESALFLTPFAVYAVILLATRGSLVPANWSQRAVVILSILAIALMAGGLYVFEVGTSARPGAVYVPATMKDGVFTPGRFE